MKELALQAQIAFYTAHGAEKAREAFAQAEVRRAVEAEREKAEAQRLAEQQREEATRERGARERGQGHER